MLIGLVSDTHIPRDVADLPTTLAPVFQGVDLILHAGDIYVSAVLDELEKLAPVLAARGNGDHRLTTDPRVKDSVLLQINGLTLGMAHAIEYPELPWYPIERGTQRYFGGPVDILVFGDSHVPVVEKHKGMLMVNSGSPTLPWGLRQPGTVGLLSVSQGSAWAKVLELGSGKILCQLTWEGGEH